MAGKEEGGTNNRQVLMKNNRTGGGGICQEVQFGEGSLNMSSALLCFMCGAWEMRGGVASDWLDLQD